MHAKQITTGLHLPFAGSAHRAAQVASRIVAKVSNFIAYEWTMHVLDGLSDEQLKDVGLNRRDLPTTF